jgi:antitoxin Phd
MQRWPVQDAKARFSEMLDACTSEGPQLVTKRGVEAAVLVPIGQWKRLAADAGPTLKDLLLSATGPTELPLPTRGNARRRPPTAL